MRAGWTHPVPDVSRLEAQHQGLLNVWTSRWDDLIDFEIIPHSIVERLLGELPAIKGMKLRDIGGRSGCLSRDPALAGGAVGVPASGKRAIAAARANVIFRECRSP